MSLSWVLPVHSLSKGRSFSSLLRLYLYRSIFSPDAARLQGDSWPSPAAAWCAEHDQAQTITGEQCEFPPCYSLPAWPGHITDERFAKVFRCSMTRKVWKKKTFYWVSSSYWAQGGGKKESWTLLWIDLLNMCCKIHVSIKTWTVNAVSFCIKNQYQSSQFNLWCHVRKQYIKKTKRVLTCFLA